VSGVYLIGGSFDPIHDGHLSLAKAILETKQPEKILFVPAQQNPLKGTAPTDGRHRWAMLQLALEEWGEPKVQAWDGELQRPGPSFTVDTIRRLIQLGEKDLVLVLGNEVYSSFSKWKEPAAIRSMAKLLVVERHAQTTEITPENGVERFHFPILPVSSTELRTTLGCLWREGAMDVKPQGIGHSVWRYIKENRLYAVSKES